ncbi:hypothetical protein DIPPA_27754 [Diplonema papillatum]|nr:hypothetical protein DIPPA_27754 [Diplonema papillatum]
MSWPAASPQPAQDQWLTASPVPSPRNRQQSEMSVRFEEPRVDALNSDNNLGLSRVSGASSRQSSKGSRASGFRDSREQGEVAPYLRHSPPQTPVDNRLNTPASRPLLPSTPYDNPLTASSEAPARRKNASCLSCLNPANLFGKKKLPPSPVRPPARRLSSQSQPSSRRNSVHDARGARRLSQTGVPAFTFSGTGKRDGRDYPTFRRETSLAAYIPDDVRQQHGADKTIESLTGWNVAVKNVSPDELETNIAGVPSLTWTPKYLRGRGRRAIILDEDEGDKTVKLLFDNPKATAWYPITSVEIKGKGPIEDPVVEEPVVKVDPAVVLAEGYEVGEIITLAADPYHRIGVVLEIDTETPEYPIVVQWEILKGKGGELTQHTPAELMPAERKKELDDAESPEAVVFRHYDKNNNGYWSFEDANRCLRETGQIPMGLEDYYAACKEVNCNPKLGFLLADLRLLASDKVIARAYRALRKKMMLKTDTTEQAPVAFSSPSSSPAPARTLRKLPLSKSLDTPKPISNLEYWSSPVRWRNV